MADAQFSAYRWFQKEMIRLLGQLLLWRAGLIAALVLALGMGFGRFAFTAVYPYMVSDGVLDIRAGSVAAAFNYGGYLLGALLAVRLHAKQSALACVLAAAGTALCLGLLAVPLTPGMIMTVRAAAGVCSAFSLVAASLWLFARHGQYHLAPLLYAGVGVGIALSSELVVAGVALGWHSRALWLLLGMVAIGLLLPVWLGMGMKVLPPDKPQTPQPTEAFIPAPALVGLYGLAGFGYIITATYLPLLMQLALPEVSIGHVWALFGLGAAPSCFVWYVLRQRQGAKRALLLNVLVQALGVALPVCWPGVAAYMGSAVLVGGTFLGTVTIAIPLAQQLSRVSGRNLVAIMTVAYSVGQIIGPLLANGLYQYSHNFNAALLLAAGALLLAAALCSPSYQPKE